MSITDKYRRRLHARHRGAVDPELLGELPPLPPLLPVEVLLQRTEEILSASRPIAKRGSRATLAPHIVWTMSRIRKAMDAAIDSWYSYPDEESLLELLINDLNDGDASTQEQTNLREREKNLKKEQHSNRRNRLRWLRSQHQKAGFVLSDGIPDPEGDAQAWRLAWHRRNLARLTVVASAEAWNTELGRREPVSTNEPVPTLMLPEDAGFREALRYLRRKPIREAEADQKAAPCLPYRTIGELLVLFGFRPLNPERRKRGQGGRPMLATSWSPGQLRIAAKRLRDAADRG